MLLKTEYLHDNSDFIGYGRLQTSILEDGIYYQIYKKYSEEQAWIHACSYREGAEYSALAIVHAQRNSSDVVIIVALKYFFTHAVWKKAMYRGWIRPYGDLNNTYFPYRHSEKEALEDISIYSISTSYWSGVERSLIDYVL